MKLGDICDVITKGTTPTSLGLKFSDEGINFIKIESISENGNFLEDKFAHISNECHQKLNRSQLKDGDLLFSIAGAIGRTAIVTQDILPANTNQALAIIRLNEKYHKSREIIYMYFNSPLIKIQYSRKKQGVAQLNLSLQDIKLLEIPEISEGRREEIVRNLKLIQALIDKRKRQLNSIDFLAKSRFLEMFGDITNNPKNIEISTLGKECTIISGGTPKTGNDEYWNGNIKWITPAEINETERAIYDTERHITEKGRRSAHLEIMPIGTVLLSSRAPIWKLAVAGSEMTCNQGFKNLIPNDRLTSIFLYYYLKGIIPEIQSLGRGATFKEISKTIVSDIKILVPPKSKQLVFSSLVEQLDKSKFRMKKCLKLLSYIRHL